MLEVVVAAGLAVSARPAIAAAPSTETTIASAAAGVGTFDVTGSATEAAVCVSDALRTGLVDKSTLGPDIDNNRFAARLVPIEIFLVVFQPVLHGDDAAILPAESADETVDRHAGDVHDPRIRGELRIDWVRVRRMVGGDTAGPGVACIATFRLAYPRVFVPRAIDRTIIVEETDDAIGVAGPNGAGRLVLLLETLVAYVERIFCRANDVHVRLRIALCNRLLSSENQQGDRIHDLLARD